MKKSSELEVITRVYDLLLWLLPKVEKFPCSHKFTLLKNRAFISLPKNAWAITPMGWNMTAQGSTLGNIKDKKTASITPDFPQN